MEAQDGDMQSQVKGMPETTRSWKRQEGLFPRNLRGNVALLTL